MEVLNIETNIRNSIRTYCGDENYNTWFRNSRFELSDVNCKILLPSEFACKWIVKNYLKKIKNILNEYDIHSIDCLISNASKIDKSVTPSESKSRNMSSATSKNTVQVQLSDIQKMEKGNIVERAEQSAKIKLSDDRIGQNNANNVVINHVSNSNNKIANNPVFDGSTRLMPQYKFDTFVVGKPNEFAYAAAKSVANSKETTSGLNPLFLHGDVGLGKTHLMHSIGWHAKKCYPHKKVLYMSAEKFMYEFVKALKTRGMIAFKDHFRSVDILLIDDIQFICGKESTQDEFFHTFNTLISNNKYLVISCDRPPSDLDNIEARIKSRLSGGVTAALYHSTYELRLGILHKKLSQLKVQLPKDVIEYLAHNIRSNIRELEGALNQVIAHMQLINKSIDLESTKEILFDFLNNASSGVITINDIQKIVSEYYDISMKDLSSNRRLKNIVKARQICMYLSRQFTSASLIEIARVFNKKDHTTVLHAINIATKWMEDPTIKNEIKQLMKRIKTW